jgi:hypothetical protein
VKHALALLGLMSPAVRLPLVELSNQRRAELRDMLCKSSTNWRGHDDVIQIRSFRGSGEPARSSHHRKRAMDWDDPRRALRPAAIRAVTTGRTRDRTRPMLQKRQKALARALSTRETLARHCLFALKAGLLTYPPTRIPRVDYGSSSEASHFKSMNVAPRAIHAASSFHTRLDIYNFCIEAGGNSDNLSVGIRSGGGGS